MLCNQMSGYNFRVTTVTRGLEASVPHAFLDITLVQRTRREAENIRSIPGLFGLGPGQPDVIPTAFMNDRYAPNPAYRSRLSFPAMR